MLPPLESVMIKQEQPKVFIPQLAAAAAAAEQAAQQQQQQVCYYRIKSLLSYTCILRYAHEAMFNPFDTDNK